MRICITNARGRLGDLVQRAQEGEDVVLIRRGEAVARLVPIKSAKVESEFSVVKKGNDRVRT